MVTISSVKGAQFSIATQTEEEKLARIAANLRRENKIEEQKIREKIRAAHEEVRRLAAQFLEIDPGIKTIVLFGSLAENNVFSIHFDIDLAVRSEKYLQLVGCGLKSSFLRISKFFENSLDPLSWNRDLIEHMRLDIDGVRPALLDRELAARIDGLRSFRHVFRNIYQTELDPKRIELVQQQLDPTPASFEKAHKEFLKKLKTIAAQLGD